MEVFGLPLHPLVVHAVVVFVPLAAIGGVVISAWKWARIRYGWLVVACALVGAVSTFVAQQAGENLYEERFASGASAAVNRHMNLGGTLLVWAILLFVGTAVVMGGQWLIDRHDRRGRIVIFGGIVITVVCGVVSIIQTVRIGHSGSAAVWGSG
ncbi:MAG: DUF2231 domain-containing protein [Propionibacteriaceae bacterium]